MAQDRETFTIRGEVQIFPGKGGWTYVDLPEEYTHRTKGHAERGLVPVTVRLGGSQWDTSLLPKGDGTLFIALKAQIRKRENVVLGDTVELSFSLRSK